MKLHAVFHRYLLFASWFVFVIGLFTSTGLAQSKGTITGRVIDSGGALLQGARVELQPSGNATTTNEHGQFTFTNVSAGNYTVSISYVGFLEYTQNVTVGDTPVEQVIATLKVKSENEEVLVTAERPHGEAESINRTRAADNILQVLPAEVITSLPNANIADSIGRMPSVTIERDEGEGKYVQIRGTQPRLSNVTIDGINVPSPERGVRQIKLDTIASDLVESVEINKTLQANQDGDGIGGSVNLITKTAGDVPSVSLYGLGGYTPIIGGRGVDQSGGTLGTRFGAQKKLGVLLGGTYDYNGRGINDIEPSLTVGSATPHYDSIDLRDYMYYRTRWGMAGSMDYKLGEGSSLYARSMFSTFRNWGQKWVYTLNDFAAPQASQELRRPGMSIGSLVLGGRHQFTTSWLAWDASVARSRAEGGSGGANYKWNGDPNIATNCYDDVANTKDAYRPYFSSGCYTPGTGDATDIRNYILSKASLPALGKSAQVNLQASASYAKQYHVGTHYGTFEFGGKIRNAHKFDDSQTRTWKVPSGTVIPAAQFEGSFTDSNYYDKSYHFTNTPDFPSVLGYLQRNGYSFTSSGVNSANYDLVERVSAGYLMNTLDLTSRLRLVTGVRFEATHVDTLSYSNATGAVTFPGGGDYLDVLPSASLRIALDKDSGLRLVYGRGLSRPDPQSLTASVSILDNTVTPNTVSAGNPSLKPEHANNFDVLYERYLNPLGLIQAGYFYKDLTDPIVSGQTHQDPSLWSSFSPTSPYVLVSQDVNAGSAHVQGFEIGFQQHLSYLPGVMRGLGISANYSYTQSSTNGLPGRSDHPALLRQAPNTWNISSTYDTRRFSMRLGMTYNGPMIYAYQWTDGADSVGIKGPSGDNYLYPHLQIDVQGSYKVSHSWQVYAYGLNLNNEVFGFYNGSSQYVVQREFYHPTFAGGVKYTFNGER